MLPVLPVLVEVVVVVEVVFLVQPPFGPTLSFWQPEKLLMETSSPAALARRRMEEKRMTKVVK